jgi:hypothetical protein
MPLWKFRSAIGRDFMQKSQPGFDIRSYLKDFYPEAEPSEAKLLIISDENLIGNCGEFVRSGELLPRASKRLKHFRSLLDGHEITMFCGVRSYETFIASAYCEGLKTSQKYLSFPEFLGRIKWSTVNWPLLLMKAKNSLSPEKLIVWKYESFNHQSRDLLRELTCNIVDLNEYDREALSNYCSYSQTAIDVLEASAATVGVETTSKIIRAVGDTLKKADGFPAFDPWDETRKRNLIDRYQTDCASIPSSHWFQDTQSKHKKRESADLAA